MFLHEFFIKIFTVVITFFLASYAIADSQTTSSKIGLGQSKQTSIEVCMPNGEKEYLSRISCPNGKSPQYERIGSFGSRNPIPVDFDKLSQTEQQTLLEKIMSKTALQPGETDYHTIDGYDVTCGQVNTRIYMDMYHCEQLPPNVAPYGFKLR